MRILDVILRIAGSHLRVVSKKGPRSHLHVKCIALVTVLNTGEEQEWQGEVIGRSLLQSRGQVIGWRWARLVAVTDGEFGRHVGSDLSG